MTYHFFTCEDLLRVILLTLPLVVSGILHMIAVKKDILSYLKKPIHQRWFGQNKTWRGFIIMPLATFPGVLLAQQLENLADLKPLLLNQYPAWVLALVLGFAYCLAELPNSYIKRRLGILEGKTADKNKWFFVIGDQADSAIGCLVAYKILLPISWPIFLCAIMFGTIIHLLFNVLLYKLGLRKNPF